MYSRIYLFDSTYYITFQTLSNLGFSLHLDLPLFFSVSSATNYWVRSRVNMFTFIYLGRL